MNLPDLERLEALAEKAKASDPAFRWDKLVTSEEDDFQDAASPDVVLALVARVRELDGMTKAGAYWEERAQEHRMRVRELEAEVAQLKVDLNEARGADVESIERIADMVKNPPEANADLRSLLAPGERGE